MEGALRILIVDRGTVLERCALSLANTLEAEVTMMHDAGQLLEFCRSSKPDVIIAELVLDYGSGGEELGGEFDVMQLEATLRALKKLHQEGHLEGVCVIATHSGSFPVAKLARLVARGVVRALLEKPLDPDDLRACVCNYLGITDPLSGFSHWKPDNALAQAVVVE